MISLRVQSYWQKQRSVITLMVAVLMFAVMLVQAHIVSAATLTSTSVTLSTPVPSATSVSYDFQASGVTTSAIQCIRFEFDTAADGSGTIPTDMNVGSATLSGDYIPLPGNWTPSYTQAASGIVTFTGTGQTPASAAGRNAILSAITNGSVADNDFFLIFRTYNNTDCSSSLVDSSVVGFLFTNGQAVSMSVEGALSFTIAGVTGNGSLAVNGATITNGLATTPTTIPFGTVTTGSNKIAAQDLTVSTNSGNGYTVYTRYTQKPTSGSNSIDDLATRTNAAPGAFSAAGTEAFGYTTEDSSLTGADPDRFTDTGNEWAAFAADAVTNEELVYNGAAVSSQTTRVGFQVGIAPTTPTGSYVTSVIYTAVPVY